MTLDQLLARLNELREKHGGGILVTVECNGYDAADAECRGAEYVPQEESRSYVSPSITYTAPENISITSVAGNWTQENPLWKVEDKGAVPPVVK